MNHKKTESSNRHPNGNSVVKGDFTADLRIIWISALAIPIGLLCAVVALVLQRMIALFTNIFYFQSITIPHELISPSQNTLGWLAILVPVVGGLIIGLMARYGSDRIRGHGIPEAIEAILIGGSRMAAEGRRAQATVIGDLDRLRRAVRRRGADHHDGRGAAVRSSPRFST